MRRGKQVYAWFPLWSDKWLWGSTRLELSPAERSVWVDFMALANKDDGHIRANESTPYPPEQLAGMFRVPVNILISTIEKCLKHEKLVRLPNGTLYIKNWEEYALTSRYKRLISGKAEVTSGKAEAKTETKTETYTKKETETDIQTHVARPLSEKELIFCQWNQFAKERGLAEIKQIIPDSTRERRLKSRMSDKEFNFPILLEKISQQSFLLGDGDRGWKADFDWILKPSNYQKIMEGGYGRGKRDNLAGVKDWIKSKEEKSDG
jgi:hypothetical protein